MTEPHGNDALDRLTRVLGHLDTVPAPVNHTSEPTQPPPRPQEAAQQHTTATHSPTTGPNQGRTLQDAHKPAHDRSQT